MKRLLFLFFFVYTTSVMYSQGNCLLYPEGSNKRKACRLGEKAIKILQGSKESQLLFDSIIKLNPKYDWAYKEKSVPYFKRGFVTKGLQILNKAIAINPKLHLTYRAYWYFQNRNYKKCIEDLERYYALPNSYKNELTPGGDKDMRLLLVMSYAKLGQIKKGISIVEKAIASYKEVDFGLLDYHVLGLLYTKDKQYNSAIKIFEKQLKIYDSYIDTYYYFGLAYKALNNYKEARKKFRKALALYKDPYRMKNGYYCFRVYKSDIIKAIKQ